MELGPIATVDNVELNFSASFGVVLRALRKAAGWTQLQLAVELHRDHTYISKWEKGVLRPDAGDLERLTASLPLSDAERVLLANAWRRSHDDPGVDSSGEALFTSLRAAATLRHMGQPRIAYELAARDAHVALEQARTARSTEAQLRELLTVAADLLLEEVKGALDFATPAQVYGGLLATNGQEHRLVASVLDDRRARVRLGLADEAVHYATGDIDKAHRHGADLLRHELTTQEPEWLAETIRAEAINTGLLGDHRGLTVAWDRFRAVEGELSEDQRRFTLEGFVRGFAGDRPDKAFEIVESTYTSLDAGGYASPVRWVQLVRSEGRLLSQVSGTVGDGDTRRRIEQALATSQSLELSKYVAELESLLAASG